MVSAILIYSADKHDAKVMCWHNCKVDDNYGWLDLTTTLGPAKVSHISTSNPDADGAVTITITLEYT